MQPTTILKGGIPRTHGRSRRRQTLHEQAVSPGFSARKRGSHETPEAESLAKPNVADRTHALPPGAFYRKLSPPFFCCSRFNLLFRTPSYTSIYVLKPGARAAASDYAIPLEGFDAESEEARDSGASGFSGVSSFRKRERACRSACCLYFGKNAAATRRRRRR